MGERSCFSILFNDLDQCREVFVGFRVRLIWLLEELEKILQRLHNQHALIIECVKLAAVPSNDRKQLDYVVARLRTVIAARTFELVLEFGEH